MCLYLSTAQPIEVLSIREFLVVNPEDYKTEFDVYFLLLVRALRVGGWGKMQPSSDNEAGKNRLAVSLVHRGLIWDVRDLSHVLASSLVEIQDKNFKWKSIEEYRAKLLWISDIQKRIISDDWIVVDPPEEPRSIEQSNSALPAGGLKCAQYFARKDIPPYLDVFIRPVSESETIAVKSFPETPERMAAEKPTPIFSRFEISVPNDGKPSLALLKLKTSFGMEQTPSRQYFTVEGPETAIDAVRTELDRHPDGKKGLEWDQLWQERKESNYSIAVVFHPLFPPVDYSYRRRLNRNISDMEHAVVAEAPQESASSPTEVISFEDVSVVNREPKGRFRAYFQTERPPESVIECLRTNDSGSSVRTFSKKSLDFLKRQLLLENRDSDTPMPSD